MSHGQDLGELLAMHREESEFRYQGNRKPLLGSEKEKGTAQSLSQRSSWFVWRMSPVGREAGLGAKRVMSQENKGCMSRGNQQDNGGELGEEGGGMVHDKASNPLVSSMGKWTQQFPPLRGAVEIRNGGGTPAQNMCPRAESVTVSPTPPCPHGHGQQMLPSVVPLLTPCSQ